MSVSELPDASQEEQATPEPDAAKVTDYPPISRRARRRALALIGSSPVPAEPTVEKS